MKIASVFFMIMVEGFTYSQPIPPVKVEECPAITEVSNIDGLKNESFWSPLQEMELYIANDSDWNNEADFSSTFSFAWGWSYFYIFIEIIDELEHSWNGEDGNPWEFDCIDLFFQLDTQTYPSIYTDNTVQLRFNRGIGSWKSSTLRTGISGEDFLTWWENTDDGWLLECAVPWTAIMPSGSLPEDIHNYISEDDQVIGFDLHSTDSDGTDPEIGARHNGAQFFWDTDWSENLRCDIEICPLERAWNDTRVFGYLKLIGDPVLEIYEPIIENDKPILYPIPARDMLHLPNTENYSQLKIYSMEGILVLDHRISCSSIDISTLDPGLYIVVINDHKTFKFIKE